MDQGIKATRRTFVYLIFIVFSILYLAFWIESNDNFLVAKDKLGFFIYVLYALSGLFYILAVICLLLPSFSKRVISSLTPLEEKIIEESVTEIEVNEKIIRTKEMVIEKKDTPKRQLTLFAILHILMAVSGLLSVIPLVVIISL
ncbi:hypothetical protein [Acholeplasma hippikon]|uniref:DUF3899 domain-containing protein n=1 Tax=Acholeplasma hippikon TaxID=264636 RepID=A0A449BIP0_9MOLU|nr:hypothetical protein [Acholeplasma hippikon]VEU82302.1 Uncharacterised protein [Acholeplasma hippikon]